MKSGVLVGHLDLEEAVPSKNLAGDSQICIIKSNPHWEGEKFNFIQYFKQTEHHEVQPVPINNSDIDELSDQHGNSLKRNDKLNTVISFPPRNFNSKVRHWQNISLECFAKQMAENQK